MAKKDKEFHDYIMNDVFTGIAGVTSRAMFGGYGMYKDGKIFAIIADGKLYFKVAESNQSDYEKAGSEPFRYTMPSGKEYHMAYWELPPDVLEDREELPKWIEKSLRIPQSRSSSKKKKR
jgi:DNA transformation protein